MPEFTVNPTRFDPYKQFKFRVKWDGRFVAGISRVSALRMVGSLPAGSGAVAGVATATPTPSVGSAASSSAPGGPDPGTVALAILTGQWWLLGASAAAQQQAASAQAAVAAGVASAVHAAAPIWPGLRVSYAPIRLERGLTHDTAFEEWIAGAMGTDATKALKDIEILLMNEAGQQVINYRVFGCYPIEYVPLPELDANQPATAIESLTLAFSSWKRDHSVVEPAQPFTTRP